MQAQTNATRRPLVFNATAPSRFWAKVDRQGPTPAHRPDLGPCWVWTARLSPDGYGQFRVGGMDSPNARAHRVSWIFAHGPIPDGLWVLHHCDEPTCVRPDHLFIGTHKDNVADRDRKGRQARGERHGWHTHPETRPRGERHGRYTHPETTARGERNGWARFTADEILAIRRAYAAGDIYQYELAEQYGTAQSVISSIVRRAVWAHLPNEQAATDGLGDDARA